MIYASYNPNPNPPPPAKDEWLNTLLYFNEIDIHLVKSCRLRQKSQLRKKSIGFKKVIHQLQRR